MESITPLAVGSDRTVRAMPFPWRLPVHLPSRVARLARTIQPGHSELLASYPDFLQHTQDIGRHTFWQLNRAVGRVNSNATNILVV